MSPVDFGVAREALSKVKASDPTSRDIVSWFQFPKVVEEYFKRYAEYDNITNMPSNVFFHGMNVGDTTAFDLDDGKTLVIRYVGMGDPNKDGTRNFQYELNGMRRDVAVVDPSLTSSVKVVVMADLDNKSHVGAPIPGMVSKVNVKVGDNVKENDILAVVEAMKMEINIVARMDGVLGEIMVETGSVIQAGELLAVIK
jgi:pyruvate carboxylase